jgi:hypothetical protein
MAFKKMECAKKITNFLVGNGEFLFSVYVGIYFYLNILVRYELGYIICPGEVKSGLKWLSF